MAHEHHGHGDQQPSSVWFDPATGAVLKTVRWSALDPGNRLFTCLALTTFGAAGLVPWGKRRRPGAPARARAKGALGARAR